MSCCRRVLGPLLVLLIAAPAAATTMVRASVEALATESEVVALGVVSDVAPRLGGPRGEGGVFTRVTLSTEEVWRGEGAGELVFWVHGGRVGDRAMQTHGQARFVVGERVVVFLDDAGGALFPTGMSQGAWSVDGARAVSRAASDALVDPATGRPAAPLPPTTLDALRARVRSVR